MNRLRQRFGVEIPAIWALRFQIASGFRSVIWSTNQGPTDGGGFKRGVSRSGLVRFCSFLADVPSLKLRPSTESSSPATDSTWRRRDEQTKGWSTVISDTEPLPDGPVRLRLDGHFWALPSIQETLRGRTKNIGDFYARLLPK